MVPVEPCRVTTLFERTDRREAEAVATLLRGIAADVERDVAFDFLAGTDVDVGVPGTMDVELELEREEGATELEVELEWTDDDERDEPVPEATAGAATADSTPDAAEEATADGDDSAATTAAEGTDDAGESTAPDTPASQATFEVYRDRAEEWRWRLRHDNGNIIADSGEGYTRKRNALGADVTVEE